MEGTPRYMAPEQWAGAELDGAVDVWALGLILYELLSGTHPYTGLDLSGLIYEVTGDAEVPSIPNREELPRPLVDLIERFVRKARKERPSASEVAEQLRSFLRVGVHALDEEESPFRGLLPFTEQHAGAFFGRDEEIARCVERLRHQAVLPVVGPSGVGKSSFVRAGVLPRLAEQGRWVVVRMRPGSRPFEVLAERLVTSAQVSSEVPRDNSETTTDAIDEDRTRIATLAAELQHEPGRLGMELRELAKQTRSRVLLFVDQLEEIVTLVEDEGERERAMVALCRAADDPSGPVRLVVTVRDDFVGRLVHNVEVRDALGSMFFLQRPGPVALESTLRKPVAASGYAYDDPELPSAMVAAVGNESACLPLLQFTARQLWEARDQEQKLLLREAYDAMGGVEGALAKHADGVLDALSANEMRAARQIFLRLVTSERTRRVVARGELLEGLGSEGTRVLEQLTGARLLTVRRRREAEQPVATVELAHESLIAGWNTLRRWLDEGQDELVFLAEASQAAALWEKRGGLAEELWQGNALAEAQRMVDKLSQVLPERVARFMAAAVRKQTRRVRLRRLLFAAVVTGLTLVVAVLGVQNQRVEQKHVEAQEQRAEAQLEGARAALGQGNLIETRGKLRLALEGADAPSARALWWQLR
ncbi:MAG: AAA family ATPase, partial [Polyangiaceae bacterium]